MRQGKNGQIRGTLKRRLMTNFLLTALIPVLIFAIISQINIQQRLKENLSDRIKSNLDTAEKNLEMVLDKYETILYDFSTDEDVLEIVRALNESRGDRESNSTFSYHIRRAEKLQGHTLGYYRSGRDHDTVKDGRDHIL